MRQVMSHESDSRFSCQLLDLEYLPILALRKVFKPIMNYPVIQELFILRTTRP